ncbi:hypothetical protein [Nitrospirillum viridazoti]|uniref:CRISPR system Cascade subunit CasB n=1 Tax=Nitrospirillum amazonense TaxID=28077 RepID=A0A560J785_9PROT|nr:hypothetical protein [Nitrospirillum amazonense]TWB64420.1 CRISPR system Cascade subunit CasB [Nitrospirillum amazonense]
MSPNESHVAEISRTLQRLAPGPLAELRRMEPGGAGTPAFWHLAAKLELPQGDIDAWQQTIRIMAILSEKGAPETRKPLHDERRPLGAALCDGGDRDWQPSPASEPRPCLSEARFARFLALPAAARGEALERISRALARKAGHGLNCADIADLLLRPDDPRPPQRLARAYYDRLDRARRATLPEGTV